MNNASRLRREAAQERPHVWAWALLALLLALAGVLWRLGGFEGGSRLTYDQPGQAIDMGPAIITPERAEAKLDYDKRWSVRVIGTCEVTAGYPFDLTLIAEDSLVVRARADRTQYGERTTMRFGEINGYGGRVYLSPGLEPMSCAVRVSMPEGFDPNKGIIFAVAELDFGDNTVIGGQPERWYTSNRVHAITMDVVTTDW